MDEDCANAVDPEEQLRIITKMKDITTGKLSQLRTTIETFTTRFASQEQDLTNLYERTIAQQTMYKNIIQVRTHLDEILDKLNTSKQLFPVLKTVPEQNFDPFMEAMRNIIDASNYLDQFSFEDAKAEKATLSHMALKASEVILVYFKDLATRSATPIVLDNFKFENGEFVCTIKEYENDPLYPISEDILKRMRTMADILSNLELTGHFNIYTEAHSKQILESLNPILSKSEIRVVQPGPLNILDLPTYKKHSHPIHIFTNILTFFFNRERAFAKTVFGEKYSKAFTGSISKAFAIYVTTVNKLAAKTEAHTDILFDLDIVGTISEVMEQILDDKDFAMYSVQISQLQHSFYPSVERVFQKYSEAVETHDPSAIPPRGGVTAVTSNVILFLGALTEYQKAVQQIGGLSLDTYINTVLNNLYKNIIEKSKHYQDPILRQLFLMHNAHYAYTAIQGHAGLAKLVSPAFIQTVEDLIQSAQKEYMNETWIKAFQILSYDPAFAKYQKGQPLTKQQKSILKAKFKGFKDAVLNLQSKHSSYCLKNVKLMEPVKNDALSKTHSTFETFYMRWHDSGFATHPEEYTAITPATLEGIINRMYGPKTQVSSENMK